MALLFVMLILYVAFRKLSDVFLLLFVIVAGILWMIGLMGWLGMAYTLMSVAVMPLMLGIDIACVMHILSRYCEERESGGDVFYSASNAVKTVGVAVFLTAINHGVRVQLLPDSGHASHEGLRDRMQTGIAFSFLLAITLLPAIVVNGDRRKKAERLDSQREKMRRRRRESRCGRATLRGAGIRGNFRDYRGY